MPDGVRGLVSALGDEDGLVALMALRELCTVLAGVERAIVEDARQQGATWQAIARAWGYESRQAAHSRWRELTLF